MKRMTLIILGALALAMLCSGVLGVLYLRESTPELTTKSLKEAQALWRSSGPASYDLDLQIGGPRAGLVEVQVRNGKVVMMRRDGITPRRRETWDVWSVPGQLDTLDVELKNAADPVASIGAKEGTRWIVECEFNAEYGYPQRYRRLVVGTAPDISWSVVSFRVVEESVEESAVGE